ncbi:hypothetical protein ACUTSW_16610 [Serratia sp. TSA_198.1]|uniref:hypothetical protein n=1 Tax=Serratia sp. TSA_198.1 TaxID=3415664 RepID=UPI0040460043
MLIEHVKSFVKGKDIMSTIRELTLDEMTLIGGCGDGNNGGDRDRTDRGAPDTCANKTGAYMIIGAFTGMPGGPPGMLGMAFAGALTGVVGCDINRQSKNNSDNKGALDGNRNANSVNGQCRW